MINEKKKTKKKNIEKLKEERPLKGFKDALLGAERDFKAAISKPNLNLIAEIKQKSPSVGLLRKDFDYIKIAQIYEKYADAISVVTDEKFFGGNVKSIPAIRNVTTLPILRKDFIIDEYQIYESRHYGADAILLISSLLNQKKLEKFIQVASSLGMVCLVEVHTPTELKKALKAKAEIIGINNRSLKTFKVKKSTAIILAKKIKKKKIIVAESGFESKKDIDKIKGKVNAVLIGSAFMKSGNIAAKIRELFDLKTKVKVCGFTNKEDASKAARLGADYIGFIFYDKSPRNITKENAKEIIKALPNYIKKVGVFVNEDIKKIKKISDYCELDLVQLSGYENIDYINNLKKIIKKPIINAFHIKDRLDINWIKKYDVDYCLFDAHSKDLYGGTGRTFDWSLVKYLGKKIFLSGGLNPINVRAAIRAVNPFAVDVASGVEESPGKKSYKKMRDFIKAAKGKKIKIEKEDNL